MGAAALCAIGRFVDGAWIGFSADSGGYRLAFGPPDAAAVVLDGDRDALLAVAVAYFEDSLDDPPPELEATQGDIAELCAWLRAGEPNRDVAALFDAAIDAIDDGLAIDVTVARLGEVLRVQTQDEQVEAVDLLVRRYRTLNG